MDLQRRWRLDRPALGRPGGGRVGLMGEVADAALAAGGKVIGVIPQFMAVKEVAHMGLSDLHVVQSMHARKAKMEKLSAAFIALPGGFGTLEATPATLHEVAASFE